MVTARELTAEAMAGYRLAARRRHLAEQHALARREQRAWELARQAAALLRERFGARRVVAFGSLVHPGSFTEWSDVDLAAEGLDPRDTLRAMELAMMLDPDIEVNLVDIAACSESLRKVIKREGLLL